MNPDIHAEEALHTMQHLEERYELEARLMQAVSSGQVHKAELAIAQIIQLAGGQLSERFAGQLSERFGRQLSERSGRQPTKQSALQSFGRSFEQRTKSPLRNLKNYMFVLNTILRIAAANGSVHPYHIDHISSHYARKIELLTTESAIAPLIREMVRKYCLLVKNHSLKGYSLLVQKVVTRIEYDLTADLSLKTQAALLNVNPSYLSSLFKKETGTTLTDYVNRKRIEHAIFLLNTTHLQIQVIAQDCGIPDVNYFTKLFKKQIGKTPSEYREAISNLL